MSFNIARYRGQMRKNRFTISQTNHSAEDEVQCSDFPFVSNISIMRTCGNIDASSISLGISRNYANSRVYGLVSDAFRCNDNKRDVAHGRQETGTSDRFSDCETTFTPRKRPSFIDPAETPGLPFFAGIRSLFWTPKDDASLNIKDNWPRERTVVKVKENPRKYQSVHFNPKFSYTILICEQRPRLLQI